MPVFHSLTKNTYTPDAGTRIQASIEIWIEQDYIIEAYTELINSTLIYMIHIDGKGGVTLYHDHENKMHCVVINAYEYYVKQVELIIAG